MIVKTPSKVQDQHLVFDEMTIEEIEITYYCDNKYSGMSITIVYLYVYKSK